MKLLLQPHNFVFRDLGCLLIFCLNLSLILFVPGALFTCNGLLHHLMTSERVSLHFLDYVLQCCDLRRIHTWLVSDHFFEIIKFGRVDSWDAGDHSLKIVYLLGVDDRNSSGSLQLYALLV